MDTSHLYNDSFFGSPTIALDVKDKLRTQEINTREERNFEKWMKIFQRGKDICERNTAWEKWKVHRALYSIWERTPRLEKSLAAEKARVESLHKSLAARTNTQISPYIHSHRLNWQRESRRRSHQKFKEDLVKLSKPVLYRARMVLKGHPDIDANQYMSELENYLCQDESLGSKSNDMLPSVSTRKVVDGHFLVNIDALRKGQNEESDILLPPLLSTVDRDGKASATYISAYDDSVSKINITDGSAVKIGNTVSGNSIFGFSINTGQRKKMLPEETDSNKAVDRPRLDISTLREARYAPLPAIKVAETVSREKLVDGHDMTNDTFKKINCSPSLASEQRHSTLDKSSKLCTLYRKRTNALNGRNTPNSSNNTGISNSTGSNRKTVSNISEDKEYNASSSYKDSSSISKISMELCNNRRIRSVPESSLSRITASKEKSVNNIADNTNKSSNSIITNNNRISDSSSNRSTSSIVTGKSSNSVNNNIVKADSNIIPVSNHSNIVSNDSITASNDNIDASNNSSAIDSIDSSNITSSSDISIIFNNRKSSNRYRHTSLAYNNSNSNIVNGDRNDSKTDNNITPNKILQKSKTNNSVKSTNTKNVSNNNTVKVVNCNNNEITKITAGDTNTNKMFTYKTASYLANSSTNNTPDNISTAHLTPNKNVNNSLNRAITPNKNVNNSLNRAITPNKNVNNSLNRAITPNINTNNTSTKKNINSTLNTNTNNTSNSSNINITSNNSIISITPNNSFTNNTPNNEITNNISSQNSGSTGLSGSRKTSRPSDLRTSSYSSKFVFTPSVSVSQMILEEDDVTEDNYSSSDYNKLKLKVSSYEEQDCAFNINHHKGH